MQKNQKKLMTHSWEKCQTDERTDRQTFLEPESKAKQNWVNNLKKWHNKVNFSRLSPYEIQNVKMIWRRIAQFESYSDETIPPK